MKDILYKGIPTEFEIGHYHSWVVDKEKLPSCFHITSVNEDGLIMSITHKTLDIRGVQFHPESVLTNYGKKLIKNWLSS